MKYITLLLLSYIYYLPLYLMALSAWLLDIISFGTFFRRNFARWILNDRD